MADREADEMNSPRLQQTLGQEPYKKASVAEHYATLATNGALRAREVKVVNRHFENRDAQVLDLGCGAGRTTQALDRRGFDVIGIDVSEPMVELANELFDHLDIRVGDATNLDFGDATFDYILFSWVGIDSIRPPDKRKQALQEIFRVLKPGGVFAVSTHNNLYALPALFIDWKYIRNYYFKNGNIRNWWSRYKIDDTDFGVHKYMANPVHHVRQLRQTGFELIELIGRRESIGRYFEGQPYYVVRKPANING
ncbi:class I SAM-dependent methyltransferase [Natronosalvus vescus]|uniref:class I SAM-dependent methyltransferase n=1 Tax=Natronosalvus vescus TaxID=2953881 RepID=UPI002091034A|nr:class I SAM-dependent methyltransferase [Natronosalvus vescus]